MFNCSTYTVIIGFHDDHRKWSMETFIAFLYSVRNLWQTVVILDLAKDILQVNEKILLVFSI